MRRLLILSLFLALPILSSVLTGCGKSGTSVVAPPSDEAARAAQLAEEAAYDKEQEALNQ
jgi:predicted small lipoprotein YifL